MRQARMKVASGEDSAVYHCVSRVVDCRFIFGDAEREMFVQFLREYEQFCGVQVLTYCLMSNHFHILVEVPKRPEVLPDEAEVLRRLKGLSGAAISEGKAQQMLAMFAEAKDPKGAGEYLEQFYQRMWDLSEFVKLLKQRFTQWFNRRTNRKGTLWEDRFKSVLVQGEGDPLVTMAAYIDLNPVRAGMVKDPAEYRWSGYGEAMAGRRRSKEGIRRIYGLGVRSLEVSLTEALRGYRLRVFTQGESGVEGTDCEGQPLRRGLDREAVLRMILRRGRIRVDEYLRCRVRYFSDGAVFGSREFVDEKFGRFRGHFSPARQSGARRMRGVDSELFTARDLRVNVFG
jgi:REP element-mobilizing transposase RayT